MHKMPYKHMNHIYILYLKPSKVLAVIVEAVNVSSNASMMELVDREAFKNASAYTIILLGLFSI